MGIWRPWGTPASIGSSPTRNSSVEPLESVYLDSCRKRRARSDPERSDAPCGAILVEQNSLERRLLVCVHVALEHVVQERLGERLVDVRRAVVADRLHGLVDDGILLRLPLGHRVLSERSLLVVVSDDALCRVQDGNGL